MSNMQNMQNSQHKLFALCMIALIFRITGISYSQAFGTIRLEGEHIERLVLHRKDGPTQRFDHPGTTIRLPAGEYRLEDVRLKNGYTFRRRSSTYHWVTVTEEKPTTFKIGAPLKQTVKIERQGSILMLNYELKGIGGETYYSVVNRGKRPRFTVFKGDKEIGSGRFEFG